MILKGVLRPLPGFSRVSGCNTRLRLMYLLPRFGDKSKGAPHLLNPVCPATGLVVKGTKVSSSAAYYIL